MSLAKTLRAASILLLALLASAAGLAAEAAPARAPGVPVDPVGKGPHYFQTAEGVDIRVRVVARGLNHPWSMAWLPDGSMLITEKDEGQIRRVIDGVLQPEPVPGAPADAIVSRFKGLLDIALHPDFANQPWVYMSYNKQLPGDKEAIAVARGRWDGSAVRDTQDIFVGEESTTNGVRLLFGRDGMLYIGVYVTTDDHGPQRWR